MLWVITSNEECESSLETFKTDVWEPLDEAISLCQQKLDQLSGETEARTRFIETRDRLIAYRCYCITMRNLSAWIVGVHGYLDADNETEKQSKLSLVQEMVSSELENAKTLLNLWNTSETMFMPIRAYGETMHDYGSNFGELMQKKISLMEEYGDRLPYIDPNYMWRMPTGSSFNEIDYMKY